MCAGPAKKALEDGIGLARATLAEDPSSSTSLITLADVLHQTIVIAPLVPIRLNLIESTNLYKRVLGESPDKDTTTRCTAQIALNDYNLGNILWADLQSGSSADCTHAPKGDRHLSRGQSILRRFQRQERRDRGLSKSRKHWLRATSTCNPSTNSTPSPTLADPGARQRRIRDLREESASWHDRSLEPAQ